VRDRWQPSDLGGCNKEGRHEKPIGPVMMAVSVLLIVLAAWLLRPNAGSGGADSAQQPLITPDLARLAIPGQTAQTPQSRELAATPRSAAPAAVSPVAQRAPVEDGVKRRILPEELKRRLEEANPPPVWELRSPDRYEKEHIPGSKLVKLPEVTALAEGLDRSPAIITNCDRGSESISVRAAQMLQEMGFQDVAALTGGTDAWPKAGYPVVSGK